MTFTMTDTHFIINVFNNERIQEEQNELVAAHNEMLEFIMRSAKQMEAFILNDELQTGVLRTPSRRTSKRKRSSAAVVSVKTKNVSSATPRRMSKRNRVSKAVTLKLEDSIVEETKIKDEISETVIIQEPTTDAVAVDAVDMPMEIQSSMLEECLPIDNVMAAQELMSELSIKDVPDKHEVKDEPKETAVDQKANESENEWMTDDEDGPTKKAETTIGNKAKTNHNTSAKSVIASTSKSRRQKSIYYTPQTTVRSTRAQTRMVSRIIESSMKTPQNSTAVTRLRDSSLTRSQQTRSRSDTKTLTDSALKRRQEAEEERRLKLLASQEKEKQAIERRRLLLQQKVEEKKMKSQEKTLRAAELREQQKQLEAQRLKTEWQKRQEIEKKRELERQEQMKRRQEELLHKTKEMEKRKHLQEQKEAAAQQKKQEEMERKQELERERQREQERLEKLISQHNSSLQQKAVANAFIKKNEVTAPQMMPKVVLTKMTASETAKHMLDVPKVSPNLQESHPKPANSTFVVPKEETTHNVSSYEMTPPPKEQDYDNYDISQIQSGDETDDEDVPRKRIPKWARHPVFVEAVHKQYGKSKRSVYREADHIFGTDTLLKQFEVDFDRIFSQELHHRYAKRTSSAVWDDSPVQYMWDESSINQSFQSSLR